MPEIETITLNILFALLERTVTLKLEHPVRLTLMKEEIIKVVRMGENFSLSHLASFCSSEEYLSVRKIKETQRTCCTQACPRQAHNNGNTGEADASQKIERCLINTKTEQRHSFTPKSKID